MKTSALVLASTFVLSALVWTIFYFLAHGDPLTQSETLVIVGICGGIVVGVRRMWTWLCKARGRHAEQQSS